MKLIRGLYNVGYSGCYLICISPFDYKVRLYLSCSSLFGFKLHEKSEVRAEVLGKLIRGLYPYSFVKRFEVDEGEFFEPIGVRFNEYKFYRNSIVVRNSNGSYLVGFLYLKPNGTFNFPYDRNDINLFLRSVCDYNLNVRINIAFKPLKSFIKIFNGDEVPKFRVSCIISIVYGPISDKKIAYNRLKFLEGIVGDLSSSVFGCDVNKVSFFYLNYVLKCLLRRGVCSLYSFKIGDNQLARLFKFPNPLLPSFSYEVNYEPLFDFSSLVNLPSSGLLLGYCRTWWGNVEVKLAIEDLPLNIAIFGVPGSGKTYLAKRLAYDFIRGFNGRVLVFDRHGEYDDLRGVDVVIRVGVDDFSINPLSVNNNVDAHVKRLSEIFSMTLPNEFGPVMSYVFRETCRMYIRECLDSNIVPSLSDYVEYLRNSVLWTRCSLFRSNKFRDKLVSLISRVSELTSGSLSKIFSSIDNFNLSRILMKNTVLDLSNLIDRDKNIFTWFMLKEIFDFKRTSSYNGTHVIICEEAHNIVPAIFEGQPTIIEYYLKEMRKFNESVWIIDQRPLSVSRNVLALCGTIICLRLRYSSDIKKLADTMGLNEQQMRYMQKLKRGKALVITPRLYTPIPINLV